MRLPGLHVEVADRSTVTPYGGLALASAFLRRFRVAQAIDERVQVLKLHLPYHESDHVIAQALNLYAGGTCIEDQAAFQHDEGVLRMLGACRIPDPTTAGDFLRRFEEHRNPAALSGLRAANAYTISGIGAERGYAAACPVPGGAPDFHRLECFAPLRIGR